MTIWVGEIEGDIRVYDPAIQLPDCPHIFLWDPVSRQMGKFIAKLTRQHIKPHGNSDAAAAYVASYQQWYKMHGAIWIEGEKQYYELRNLRGAEEEQQRLKREQEWLERKKWESAEAERIAKLTPDEWHKEKLEKLSKKYHGVRLKREQERLEREKGEAERLAESERIAKLTPTERHKEELERLGKKYHGVRQVVRDTRKRRITHCYSCKQPLDNSIDIECISCNWIICKCGACGCGYSGIT